MKQNPVLNPRCRATMTIFGTIGARTNVSLLKSYQIPTMESGTFKAGAGYRQHLETSD